MLVLLSFKFLGLAGATAAALAITEGTARQIAFLAANLIFVWGLLLGPVGATSTILFALLGYGLVRLNLAYGKHAFLWSLGGLMLLFVYMRDYAFLGWVLPEPARMSFLATAGLSFLFFKVVHVMIEAHSGTLERFSFLDYMNYGLNFTAFTMGPIQRYQDFDAQWYGRERKVPLEFEAHLDAVLRILVGLFKAYVLAKLMVPLTLMGDPNILLASAPALLVSTYAFYFYLYFNFAGYCDVVIGIGGLLGVQPPENFDRPFLARNISDFWSRFHRSLTSWLTDYVFSPTYKWALGQRRWKISPLLAMNGALLLTMLVSGLWHGTTLSFFLFGLAHGLYFVVFRTWEAVLAKRMGKRGLRAFRQREWVRAVGIALTFHAVALSLVFFRLDAQTAFRFFGRLLGLN